MNKNIPAWLSLFTSTSTLVCCALPALIVAVAGGAALAGLVSNFPQLVWLSEHKIGLFVTAGLMLAVAGWVQWKNRDAPCPIEPDAAKSCKKLRRRGLIIYITSVGIFCIGFFFAFLAEYLI